ncbi:PTS lactose/cellobiose transporter subunit IIA [Amphibacillus sp. Q70]|uniref:PTS lactose/cellobiose transporter subunit IIA n=1 Tax=Amphibacillus sp. Q70 TaxID=3453416 RepID=UPI003F85C8BB
MTKKNEHIEKNPLIEVSMNIIIHAGNARSKAESALDAAERMNFETADTLLKEAKEDLVKAHNSQTKIIQDETRGISYPHNLLFTHAQDTLMTIKSEVNLTKRLLNMYKLLLTQSDNEKN